MRLNFRDKTLWTKQFTWIVVLSLSYLYCLPLLRTGVVGGITASEIRGYDLVFAGVLLFGIAPMGKRFFQIWSQLSRAHYFLFLWMITAFFWLFLTLYIASTSSFLIGLIRYIRFFAFASIFVLGFMWIREKRQLNLLFDIHTIALTLIGIIGTLQSLSILPNLWPSYYAIYWGESYLSTATLSPNHSHYSVMMAFGIIMIITRMSMGGSIKLWNTLAILPMLYSMVASQGRSGWLVLGVYILSSIILVRKLTWLPVAMIIAGSMIFLVKSNISAGDTSIQSILLYRSITSHEDTDRSILDITQEDRSWIARIDDSRWNIYSGVISYWISNPVFFIMGAGFQNAVKGIGGVAGAAHNAYLNIIAEQGILGFFIYMAFLFSLFRLGWQRGNKAPSKTARLYAMNWICLYLGLLAANFFGEFIYPGRALFTFLGTFFFTTVLFLHPAWSHQTPKPARSNKPFGKMVIKQS